ncbi:MAG: nitrate/nitrite transporter NrtS [Beijerinckiaceae bacterium]
MSEWLKLALSPNVRMRATKVALLVGVILAAINYGDRLFEGSLQPRDVVKLLMTFVVPYCVSTYSAVSAMQEAARNARGRQD